jgi:toxin ParE1/3/4
MAHQIVWAEPAIADLDIITAYVARRNVDAAERLRTAILDHVEILSTFPFIGPTYARDRQGTTREIICGLYRIFYRVLEDVSRVEILCVWHGARQEPNLSGRT